MGVASLKKAILGVLAYGIPVVVSDI